MKIFKYEECATPPRADMFLPTWLKVLGIVLNLLAAILLIITIVAQVWWVIIGVFFLSGLGIAAMLCYKNQSIKIIDESKFEYTTFLGKKKTYNFSDIKELRENPDSLTLFVGDGKVHIESCVNISERLIEKIDSSLKKEEESATSDF